MLAIQYVENLKIQIENNISDVLVAEIEAIYLYGSNAESILNNEVIVSREFDLLFVFKEKRSERQSDVDLNLFNCLVDKIYLDDERCAVIFNGEYPIEGVSSNKILDFIADNMPSIATRHPSSVITANSPLILIWGKDVYQKLKGLTLNINDLIILAEQKKNYLNRVFGSRRDEYAIRTCLKGSSFILKWFLNIFPNKTLDFYIECNDSYVFFEKIRNEKVTLENQREALTMIDRLISFIGKVLEND